MTKRPKRKAIRNPITGRIDYYTNTKTVGLRNPITGKIEKRISKKEAKTRGFAARTYTIWDEAKDVKKNRKKKSWLLS
ncbi:MAG: hypothetical protein U9Q22_05650 [Candidatus Altiarchaeota archaeon]|nr:hypothetical protein [Candidatus Altiarchaeota archaeon]